jgi:hypothetical protein
LTFSFFSSLYTTTVKRPIVVVGSIVRYRVLLLHKIAPSFIMVVVRIYIYEHWKERKEVLATSPLLL